MRYSVLVLPLFMLPVTATADFDTAPESICKWMDRERFRGNLDYHERKNGVFRCASNRKKINFGEPVLSNVRYVAEGSSTSVGEVRLEMEMRSFRQPQQALRKFREYAEVLAENAADAELPDGAIKAIMSGIEGKWQVGEKIMELQRVQDHGSSYDFYFRVY